MAPAGPSAGQGLYDSSYEHDACGVGFVADLPGRRSHEIVTQALTVLRNLDHRGAKGSDPETGDGAGILTQIPDEMFREACGFALPDAGLLRGRDGVPAASELPSGRPPWPRWSGSPRWRAWPSWAGATFRTTPRTAAAARGPCCRTWRSCSSPRPGGERGLALDRRAFCLRKRAEHEAGAYFVSLSSATIVYKGMLTALQLEQFYPDLADPRYASALALVHSRFSTNTFPSWPLAHPYRFIAHNGEINTIRGNRNWMRAREALLHTELIGRDADGRGLERLLPILDESASDSASFDACLELLHMGGRSLPHAVLMMIPEPWENHEQMDPALRAFYRFHADADGAVGRARR